MASDPPFGQRLQFFLDRRGMSQTDLARRVGVFPSAVTMWCSGKTKPKHGRLEAIAVALGVPLAEFFGPLDVDASAAAPQE